jgi:hypothetical protein
MITEKTNRRLFLWVAGVGCLFIRGLLINIPYHLRVLNSAYASQKGDVILHWVMTDGVIFLLVILFWIYCFKLARSRM